MSLAELIQQPFASVPELIRAAAAEHPEAIALIQDDERVTYRDLDGWMDRIAASLQRDGLRPKDVIAICAGTSPAYAAVYLGALRAGVTVAPLAPSATAESLATMIDDASAALLFVDEAMAEKLAGVRERIGAGWITLDGSNAGRALDDWLLPEGAGPEPVEIQPEWPFNIIYSSGTTGTPKGIVQPHRMRFGHVRRGATPLYGIGPGAVTLISTPLYSNTTLVPFFQTICLGGTALMMARFDARRYLELAERHRVTHTILVPVQYQRIMAVPEFDDFDLSSFQLKLSTSAPFPAEVMRDVLARWPGGLIDVYGMTEGGGTMMLLAHEHPDKLHTVGQPSEGHDVRLIDDDGNEVGPGGMGEVVGHSPATMIGYHNQPEKTAETEWYSPEGKRFIRTGDVGRFDEDGFLVLMDRKKDMIISGGEHIYSIELESAIAEHPDVLEVAVIAIPDDKWGEVPKAFVVPRPGADLTEEDIIAYARKRVAPYKRPKAVAFGELPKTSTGKVQKHVLREREWGGHEKRIH